MSAAQGERIPGGFILITGIDGIRYAVRHNSVAVIHDADECQDETLVQLHGGAVVRVALLARRSAGVVCIVRPQPTFRLGAERTSSGVVESHIYRSI